MINKYFSLSSCADRKQLDRIKQVNKDYYYSYTSNLFSPQLFEKKNQKSAQNIAQLQKKLENYQKKVRDIEQGTLPHPKHRKEVLKAVGAGIKVYLGMFVGLLFSIFIFLPGRCEGDFQQAERVRSLDPEQVRLR